MSETIETLDNKIKIMSFADRKGFSIAPVHENMGSLGYAEHSWDEYGKILKGLWEDYLISEKRPKLSGHTISDRGLVVETLHYIAPQSFYGSGLLESDKEDMIYWLKRYEEQIDKRIEKKASEYLKKGLTEILKLHYQSIIS